MTTRRGRGRRRRDDGPGGGPAELAAALRIPDDPSQLSFLLAGIVQVEPETRQQLLEATSAEARLRQLDQPAGPRAELLRKRLAPFQPDRGELPQHERANYAGPRQDGHWARRGSVGTQDGVARRESKRGWPRGGGGLGGGGVRHRGRGMGAGEIVAKTTVVVRACAHNCLVTDDDLTPPPPDAQPGAFAQHRGRDLRGRRGDHRGGRASPP